MPGYNLITRNCHEFVNSLIPAICDTTYFIPISIKQYLGLDIFSKSQARNSSLWSNQSASDVLIAMTFGTRLALNVMDGMATIRSVARRRLSRRPAQVPERFICNNPTVCGTEGGK